MEYTEETPCLSFPQHITAKKVKSAHFYITKKRNLNKDPEGQKGDGPGKEKIIITGLVSRIFIPGILNI